MPTKKYNSSSRREKNGGDNEIVGIVLVIISAFILLCIVITPILGPVSRLVRNVVIGLLGIAAYPMFLCTLILGVALIQDRRVSVSGKYILYISVTAVALLLLLQLATSHAYLGGGFSSYVSKVYHGLTAAGLLFGVLAYGIQAVITPVAAYVLFSIVIVAMALLMAMPLIKGSSAPRRKKEAPPAAPQPQFVKGTAVARPVKPVTDNTLFVDNIIPRASEVIAESGTFGEIDKPSTPAYSPLGSAAADKPLFEPYRKVTADTGEGKKYPSEAHRILFGDADKYFTPAAPSKPKYDISKEQSEYFANYTLPITPASSAPDIKDETSAEVKKPPKKVHFDPLPEVPVPPEKDFSDRIVGGEIINGDDLSRKIAETIVEKEPVQTRVQPQAVRAEGFDTRKIEPAPVRPREDLPPITNGDYFGVPEKRTPEPRKPAPTAARESGDVMTPERELFTPLYERKAAPAPAPKAVESPFSDSNYGDRKSADSLDTELICDEPVSRPTVTETNIDSADDFDKPLIEESAEYRLEQMFREAARKSDNPRETTLDIGDEPEAEQPHTGSMFDISDEVTDLSEDTYLSGDDHTGYYEQVTPAMPETKVRPFKADKPVPPLKSGGQLKIDDYVSQAPVEVKPKKKKHTRYTPPSIDLLTPSVSTAPEDFNEACEERARLLEETLRELKLPATVNAITRGPAVTRYELDMPVGIPVKRIEQYSSDIEYYLAANGKIRIETPIPGKRAVGIEVPNEKIDIVTLREIICSKEFQNAASPVTVALGKDIAGNNIVCNLEKMPHLLIAGATGSGKSACLNSIIISMLYKASPDDVRMILIDPKRVEFNDYKGMPHLLTENIVNDAQEAINALKWARAEMERRYMLFGPYGVRNLQEYNKTEAVKSGEADKLPYIVLIVDELAELMMSSNRKELEDKIMSMAQKARAAGIHLILATQRPSVDVITGTIKANLPSRIAFSVRSLVDSRTILDQSGAETLLGRGDMLYAPLGQDDPKRVQGAYVTSEEVVSIASYVRENNTADFDESIADALTHKDEPKETSSDDTEDEKEFDDIMPDVLKCIIEAGTASISMIQRRFSVGYARAARIIDQMEQHKFISPAEGSKPRSVYISREEYNELFGGDL